MKTYRRDLRAYAVELIEKYPTVFSTDVAENMRVLEPMFNSVDKQADEKLVDSLATLIANMLESARTRRSLRAKPAHRKKRKKAKKARFKRK